MHERTYVRPSVVPVVRTRTAEGGWQALPNGRKRRIAPID